MALEGRRIEVQGTVQGVGFRPWIYRLARDLGLGGKVHNDARGVTIEAFGHPQWGCGHGNALVEWCTLGG
jgi:hydrogenase maturation protein HypF